jgi:DNA polymerase III alpha subunit
MSLFKGDVDIDVPTSFNPIEVFPNWVRASVLRDGELVPHPCGVYPQNMARDPISKLASIPYDQAEDFGFLKVDFLHIQYLQKIKSREDLEALASKEPDWALLELPSVHPKLFQLSKHGDLLTKVKPRDLLSLSDCMALIRPGKKNLLPIYLKHRESTRKILYAKDESGYSFKKAHAVAYSYNVIIQLNLIEQGRL